MEPTSLILCFYVRLPVQSVRNQSKRLCLFLCRATLPFLHVDLNLLNCDYVYQSLSNKLLQYSHCLIRIKGVSFQGNCRASRQWGSKTRKLGLHVATELIMKIDHRTEIQKADVCKGYIQKMEWIN